MPTRFGIPSEAFNMQTDTERMAAHLVEQTGRQEIDNLTRKTLCLGFH